MNTATSHSLFKQAQDLMPGGVNSPVRAFKNVGSEPIIYDRAKGARVWDVDGNEYVDFIGSWGPMILGHGVESIQHAVAEQMQRGISFGAPCRAEIDLAQRICDCVPDVEMVRMVSSGTEATMSAIRLARGITGKDKLIKFEGNYHGHSDSLLVSAGSGVATFSMPGTPGLTKNIASDTLVAQYNNLSSVEALFKVYSNDVAAIIVEPVAGNMGVVAPRDGFLEGLRTLCDAYNALLIFDEVITGFRVALGGAQERFGVHPDIRTFGKIIGGGFPVGCVAGSKDIMEHFSPVGSVYQAGTLSGNPIAMTAGTVMLDELSKPGVYDDLEEKGKLLGHVLQEAIATAKAPCTVNQCGSVATLFFTKQAVESWGDAATCDF
ncbi:MAG: glutamate-1-semialdehyde 2,1-aminomutase, partial [Eggerthellaceae bacterium]|nr:glutamate-1-semialdehyde 2,1-aminomutase [Eggerthellaceae bacterium]